MMYKTDEGNWIVEVEDATDGSGDAIVPIPEEFLEALGIGDGDEVNIVALDDGSFILKPKQE